MFVLPRSRYLIRVDVHLGLHLRCASVNKFLISLHCQNDGKPSTIYFNLAKIGEKVRHFIHSTKIDLSANPLDESTQ